MVRTLRTFLFGTSTAGGAGDAGLLLFRLWAGLALAFLHGIRKVPPSEGFVDRVGGFGFPLPAEFWAWAAAFAEFGGGLLLAVGLLTRPAAALVVLHFVVVVFIAHAGDSVAERELPLFFLFAGLLHLLAGAGRYSADGLIGRAVPGLPDPWADAAIPDDRRRAA